MVRASTIRGSSPSAAKASFCCTRLVIPHCTGLPRISGWRSCQNGIPAGHFSWSFVPSFDVAIIGAGAAGMMCAATAGQRGRRVVLIDHYAKVGEKIRISGGGRCNFTNLHATHADFLSANPDFCRSALARYTPADFIALVERHGIAWHEKTLGQLFC